MFEKIKRWFRPNTITVQVDGKQLILALRELAAAETPDSHPQAPQEQTEKLPIQSDQSAAQSSVEPSIDATVPPSPSGQSPSADGDVQK